MSATGPFREFQYPTPPLYADGDSDALQSALRRISPSHAPVTITAVELLDVRFRQAPVLGTAGGLAEGTAWELSWEPVATIALAATSS